MKKFYVVQAIIVVILIYIIYAVKTAHCEMREAEIKLKKSLIILEDKMLDDKVELTVDMTVIEDRLNSAIDNVENEIENGLDDIMLELKRNFNINVNNRNQDKRDI